MNYAPLHTFWDAGQENDHERAEQFSRKINKRSTYITHYIRDMVYAYWLFLVKCVASSPADCTQVQENLSLPCNNSPSTSMISVCRGVSSPLLRYHDQNVRRAAVLIAQCLTVFRKQKSRWECRNWISKGMLKPNL
jgi:hypothetical protein